MFRLAETIRRTETGDGAILLDVRRGRIFCLNPLGSAVVGLLELGFDEPAIAREISDTYAVPLQAVRLDISQFIEDLNKREILEVAGDSSESSEP